MNVKAGKHSSSDTRPSQEVLIDDPKQNENNVVTESSLAPVLPPHAAFYQNNLFSFNGEDASRRFVTTIHNLLVDFYIRHNHTAREILYNKEWKTRFILVDVGANTGQTFLMLTTGKEPDPTTPPNFKSKSYPIPISAFLFEANPINADFLYNSFRGDPRVYVSNMAILNRTGEILFSSQYANQNNFPNPHGRVVLEKNPLEHEIGLTFKVGVSSLQEAIVFLPQIHFLKISTQGSEFLVLKDATKILKKTSVIMFRCNKQMETILPEFFPIHQNIWKLLSEYGFQVFKLSEDCLVRFDNEWYNPVFDEILDGEMCVAMRKSKLLTYVQTLYSITCDEKQEKTWDIPWKKTIKKTKSKMLQKKAE